MQKIFICTLLLLTFQIAGAADPPNVIIIFADDLGYGDLACYGHPTIKTPHLDRMAREGMRFTQFYAAASVCTPSRAGLLTGRYPVRTGMVKGKIPGRVLFPNDQTGLPLNEVTIAEVLKERDYHTYMVGKWHLGHLPEYLPTRQGFDHYYGIPYSNDMDHVGPRDGRPAYWNVPLLADTNIVERPVDQTTLTRRYTEKALAFIEAHQKEPFFLYLAHTMPHIPLFASADFLNQSKRGLYGDVVEEIDWSVGQILDALAQLDLDQNTLVIFTSDNGPWLVQQERGGSAGLLRDGKGTTWEGGLRVPMIAWRPGVIPGRTTTTALATTLDLLPTVAEMSGAQAPENIDGRSLLPLLRGQEHRPREYFAYYRNDEVYAVRYGPWKAHYITQTEYPAGPQEHHDPPLLFNLETDPSERFNRAESHPGIIAKIDAWRAAHLKTVSTAFAPSLEAEAFLETARVTGGRLRVQQILSLLEYQASDLAGNTAACLIRVKVEKMGAPSPLADLVACPDDQVVNTNLGECGALVNGNNISPAFGNVCADGLSVVYSIQHEQDDEARSGIYHGGDLFFSPGLNTVQYRVQNQPLLLISEITHHLPAPPPGAPDLSPLLQPGADVLEIANFGPAGLEVGGLGIERIHATGQDTLTLPSGSLLPAGKVMTIHFGDGVDTPEEGFFHVPGAADLPQNAGAAYVISHAGTVLDVVVIGNIDPAGQSLLASVQPTDWSGALGGSAGSFLRRTAWDTHTAADFTAPDACRPATLGNWNPEWPQGNHIAAYLPLELSSLQQTTCSFTVTIEDHEIPALGSAGDPAVQTNDSFLTIEAGECLTASIEWTEDVETADVNVYLAGQTPAFGDLSFTLISPAGREVVLAQGVCTAANAYQFTLDSDAAVSIAGSCGNLGSNGHFRPQNELGWFDGESALGVWTLQIGHAGNLSADPATLSEWRLEISSRDAYSQPDEVLENDPGECGAEYSWTHPLFFDNCPGGEMHMQIHDGEGMLIADLAIPPANWGEPTSRFFDIGENTVQYLLTDEAGNVKNYTFSVAVEDVETPALQCPDDLTVTLPPGECHTSGLPLPVTATDNCGVTDLAYDPPQTVMGIGSTDLTLTAADAAGNVDSCTFNITVAEHLPGSVILACNDEINLNLGSDCEAEITADMLLEGNDYRCYDNYIVQVYPGDVGTDGDPIPTSPFVNLDYVDQQMVAEVCDPETGFCCWGYVNVEYKVTPQFICPADTVVSCNMNMDPEYMGAPVVTSCVPGGASVTYSDEMIDHGACASPRATLMRTWTVSNALGMDTSETQHIMIQTFDLDQIDFPSHFDDLDAPALSCGSVNADPSLIEPENTGFPTIDGELFGASDAYCSTSIIYTDEIYNLCAGSYDLHRIWKVLNTCVPVAAGVNPREYIQVIKVADMADPEITCPGDITVGASPFNCRGAVILPEPDITDACSNAPYAITVSTGTLSELNGVFNLSNLPVGEHEVVYLATDGCNRSADCSFKVTVIDGIPPISMISEAAELNLSADGYGKLEADEIDQGSWDNCGVTNVQVRRAFARDSVTCEPVTAFFSEWGPYVEFRCCDINEEVFIEMRATDGYGNSDVSSMTVLVKDHLRPYCIPPEETDIDCADLPPDFDPMDTQQLQNLFGTPEPFDNCSAVWEELDPEMSMQNCSAGLLTRRFRAIDGNGSVSVNNCSQAITINGFQNYEIRFPQDAEAVCGIPNPDTLIFNELGCDLLAVSADDETFAASGDECYQINRTYRVINWCEYDGESDPIIVPRDEDCDGAPKGRRIKPPNKNKALALQEK